MKETYGRAIEFVLRWERWISNNPKDPGGLSIWGITSKWHPEEVKLMKDMTEEESRAFAIKFYRKEYWDRVSADSLPFPIDWLTFDTAVNQGVIVARSLQVKYGDNWREFIIARLKLYIDLPGQVMEGWHNRVFDLWKQIRNTLPEAKGDRGPDRNSTSQPSAQVAN